MTQDATLQDLLNAYSDGVPVYLKTSTIITLGLTALVVIALGALAVNTIKKL